jgi:predicted nuclease with TOPRIM domain
MPTLKELFSKELDDLKTLRDEIRVKAHLARADMKDEIAKLESKWPEVEKAAKEIEAASLEAGEHIEKAAQEVFSDLRKAYEDLVAKPKRDNDAKN